MSDKLKFYKMTKPIKFRRLKLVYGVGKERFIYLYKYIIKGINYLINSLLYKLNILERYSYKDCVVQSLALPYELSEKTIEVKKTFRGVVHMFLEKTTYYDIDYYYYLKKNGDRKITYHIKNVEDCKLCLVSHLRDVEVQIVDKWYRVNNLPILKVAKLCDYPTPIGDINTPLKPPKYETVEYDLTPLKNLRFKVVLGYIKETEISDTMQRYYYDFSCGKFEEKLKTMSLKSIMKN